ncbi:MAG: 3-phosphoshikimate 1-carboxyvinyltransferase [Anaeroplasmataceae bacterium]
MNVTITPAKLKGSVVIPPSKSLSHRAIIAASLASGTSKISNIIYSEDIKATINAMRACGATILEHEDYLEITGSKVKRVSDVINANESGSTIRFMIPIALTCDEPITFVGENNLVKRPLNVFTDLFDEFGIKYEVGEDYLPMKVYNGLKSGVYKVRGDISSQFITGLLYALPLLDNDSSIVVTTKLESKGYIDLTMDILKKFGIIIETTDYKVFNIKGNQSYKPCDYTVEGDYSQVAFWAVANCLGAEITMKCMNENSYQGDKKIIDDIKDFGGNIYFKNGDLYADTKVTHGATIDFAQSPDLGPILTVLASLSEGESKFVNIERLRIKECDRVTCMVEELRKLGALLTDEGDHMSIIGVDGLKSSLELDSHNDHRIVMALAIASICCDGPIKIKNASAIKKSYPHFFKAFESVGGIVQYEE